MNKKENLIFLKEIIDSLIDNKNLIRWKDIFDFTMKNYNTKINYKYIEKIIFSFVTIFMESSINVLISDNKLYIFKDKRFCIPFDFLFENEIESIIKYNSSKHTKTNKIFWNSINIFETEGESIEINKERRKEIVLYFILYIFLSIENYFKIMIEKPNIVFQYKIILYRKFIGIFEYISSKYDIKIDKLIDIINYKINNAGK